MKLYIIKAFNNLGGCIGTYYVTATGVNHAKMAIRERERLCSKLEVVDIVHNLIAA
jgi:hypothetical protein